MDGWPPLSDESLLARLALADDEFFEVMRAFAQAVPRGEFSEAVFERALGYPWERPGHSFLLDGTTVLAIDELPPLGGEPRYPLLAIGSNGSPDTLIRKLADLPPDEQRLAVITGELHDFDIGAAGLPTFYGSFAGTIFGSPGTVVSAALLLVTAVQMTVLAVTERSYSFGRLDAIRFEPDLAGMDTVSSAFAFVSRWGAHCIDGAPVALAAIPASARSAPAYTQEQLLDRVASLALGEAATGRDLVRRITEEFGATGASLAPALRELTQPFASDRWTPWPGATGR